MEEEKKITKFFEGALIEPRKVKVLKYQTDIYKEITNISGPNFYKNWGIVLPTGTGKTYIAMLLADFFCDIGSILMMAPTNPLLQQHYKTFQECLRFPDEVHLVAGGNPKKRNEIWNQNGIFLATPQTVAADLKHGRLRFDKRIFSMVICDEAHLAAAGKYAYCKISQYARTHNVKVIAMTASPGNEGKRYRIKKNLNLGRWIIKTEKDEEVKEHTHAKEEIPRVDALPKELDEMRIRIEKHLKEKATYFHRYNYRVKPDTILRRKQLKVLRASIVAKGRPAMWHPLKVYSIYGKWLYLYEVLMTENYESALRYMEKLEKEAVGKSRISAVYEMCTGLLFQWVKVRLKKLIGQGKLHPKAKALLELLDYIWKPGYSIVIFGNSYKVNQDLTNMIEQSKFDFSDQVRLIAGKKFMNQKTQQQILKDFTDKKFSILISTTVLELGMHLPVLDALISYSVPRTDISYVQRRGRVGRVRIGTIYVLMVKHEADRTMFFATRATARSIEDKMQLAFEF